MKDVRFQKGQHANIYGYEFDFEIHNLFGRLRRIIIMFVFS